MSIQHNKRNSIQLTSNNNMLTRHAKKITSPCFGGKKKAIILQLK